MIGIKHGKPSADAALIAPLGTAPDNMGEFAAAPDKPGTNYLEFSLDSPSLDWVAESVSGLRHAGAALIVLSAHWGPKMRITPSHGFRHFAHAAIERGVDVIHGHSAHVVQAVERHGRGVILYDTGNFIDDYWKFPFRRTTWSFIFNLSVENTRPVRLQLVPILIHASPLGIATGDVFQAITGNLGSLCAAVGTTVIDTPEGLEIALS